MDQSPGFYSKAFARLASFANEPIGWNGCGGRPASTDVVVGVSAFLASANAHSLTEPSLVLGGDGHVSAVWQDDAGWYISADICDSKNYVFGISRIPDLMLIAGVAKTIEVDPSLVEYVQKVGRVL